MRKVGKEDVCDIKKLADTLKASNVRSNRHDDGFLVSGFSEEDYLRFVNEVELFHVLVKGDALIGFILAFDFERSGNYIGQPIFDVVNDGGVLIKQVAVKRSEQRKGYGAMLYKTVMADTKRAVAASIALEPRNNASIAFHEKLGFTKTSEYVPDDGMLRGVWIREGFKEWQRTSFLPWQMNVST